MIKSDCHMHTCFSADSEATVTSACWTQRLKKDWKGSVSQSYGSGLSGDPRFSGKCISQFDLMSILDSLTV